VADGIWKDSHAGGPLSRRRAASRQETKVTSSRPVIDFHAHFVPVSTATPRSRPATPLLGQELTAAMMTASGLPALGRPRA